MIGMLEGWLKLVSRFVDWLTLRMSCLQGKFVCWLGYLVDLMVGLINDSLAGILVG